jgi:hypothetical protein
MNALDSEHIYMYTEPAYQEEASSRAIIIGLEYHHHVFFT